MKNKEVAPAHVWDTITESRVANMVKMELKHCSVKIPEHIQNELFEALKVIARNEDQLVITTCLVDYVLHREERLYTTTEFVNIYILDRLYNMYDKWCEQNNKA